MKSIFKYSCISVLLVAFTLLPTQKANAQLIIAEVIKKAIVKVIKALDLQVQRLQNKTIVLQNAQKAIENTMSKLKLDEISDWNEKQRKLYADYFQELSKVKNILSDYKRIKAATEMQVALVQEYKHAYSLFKQDKNFTDDEIRYMADVYSGMVDESIKSLEQLFLVVSSFKTQMTDAKRVEIINRAADGIELTYNDLKEFNAGNIQLSFQRSKDMQEVIMLKHLYGLPQQP